MLTFKQKIMIKGWSNFLRKIKKNFVKYLLHSRTIDSAFDKFRLAFDAKCPKYFYSFSKSLFQNMFLDLDF